MNNMIKICLALLTLTFTASVLAAPDKAPEKPSSYEGASLAELIAEMEQMQAEKKLLGAALTAKFSEVVPKGPQSYGEFDWRTVYLVDFIATNAMGPKSRQHAAIQIHVHPTVDEAFRKHYPEECHGYPAKRLNDKWVWVLVGRVELRLSIMDKEMQSNATLDSIIESFDLKTIETL